MALVKLHGMQYHVDGRLFRHWEKNSLDKVKKQNADRVYIVDGRERSGKSTFSFQQMGALDPSAFDTPEKFVSRVCFAPEDFNKAVRETKNGVIVFDEAFRGLSSRSALSKVNKQIIQTLMEMGQNNNIIFIVLPSFFMLDVYPSMLRSDGLFHITFDNKTNLRAFHGYNRQDKNKIYKFGIRRGWAYTLSSKFRGRFGSKFPGGKEYEDAYLKKKANALKSIDTTSSEGDEDTKYKAQRNSALRIIKEISNMPYKEISERMSKEETPISLAMVGIICGKKWRKPV